MYDALPYLKPSRRSTSLLALVATVAVAGCGSSSSSGDAAATSGDDSDAARVKLTQCLRDNGVNVPDSAAQGGAPAMNLDRGKLQEAMNGPCKSLQAEAFGNISDADRQEMQDAFQAFAQCMRDQGVDVPNITMAGGGSVPPAGGESTIDPDDPKVAAANERCRDKLPQGLPGGGR